MFFFRRFVLPVFKKIYKCLAAVTRTVSGTLLILAALATLLLDHTTDTIITMEQDPSSGMVTVELEPDGWLPWFASVCYQVDGGSSREYSGPFLVCPEQAVTAYISLLPKWKWLNVAKRERVWDLRSYTASVRLWFMDDGSAILSDPAGKASEYIPSDFDGYKDLINTVHTRLNVSGNDIYHIGWSAVQAGSYQVDVTVCTGDVDDPNSVVWVSFVSGGQQISPLLFDAYLFMPHLTDSPALAVAELVGDPDGLDRKISGRVPGTVCDGQIVAVPLSGPRCLQISQGEVWSGLDVSGLAGDALRFGACNGILLEGDQLQRNVPIYAEHFYTMLYRCEQETDACITDPVTLEPELDQWLDESFSWAIDTAILAPDDDGKYYIMMDFSRTDMALMLYRYFGVSWTDADGETAFAWAVETGLLTQKGDRGLDPDEPVTRDEALEVIARVFRLKAGLDGGKRLHKGDLRGGVFFPDCLLPAKPQPFMISYA